MAWRALAVGQALTLKDRDASSFPVDQLRLRPPAAGPIAHVARRRVAPARVVVLLALAIAHDCADRLPDFASRAAKKISDRPN
jgi:hypothetical protein